jgi:hypothetical protein
MSQAPYEEEADDQHDFHGGYSSGGLSPEARSYQRSRALRRFIKFTIAFLLFASAVGFGIYAWGVKDRMQGDLQAFKDRGVEVAEEFLSDLQAEHYDAAYERTSTEYKKRFPEKQFEDFILKRRDVVKEPFKEHRFESMQGSLAVFGKKVTAEYRCWRKLVTGKRQEVVITILRENGELKVDDLSISQ